LILENTCGHNTNKEKALEEKIKNPDLLCVGGSNLYGTATPESDKDLRGFLVPPYEYLIGLSNFEQSIKREPDTINRLRDLIQVLGGDPGADIFTSSQLYGNSKDLGLEKTF